MQYRISTLVVIFSASTALAYLDCGGGRAPPKTTVPGCPGYVGPATVVSTSTATYSDSSYGYHTVSYHDATSSASNAEETAILSPDGTGLYTVYEDPDGPEGCYCSGYLCEYAMPGCVNLDITSTITANPGWETKTFDPAAYYSYAKTASAGGELSIDGYRIELPTATLTPQETTSGYGYTTSSKSRTVSTLATSTLSAYTNSTASVVATSANVTVSSPAQASVVTASRNSASRPSGMASIAAFLVSAAAAITLL